MAAAAANHYVVLGLPSGEEGARLSEQEITKAYRSKARELHPDKRRHDPYAHANFLNLQASYQVLKDENQRKLFDDDDRRRRITSRKRDNQIKVQQNDSSKRRKMMADLEERERSAANLDRAKEDDVTHRKFKEEVATIVAAQRTKSVKSTTTVKRGTDTERGKNSMNGLDEWKFDYPRRRANIAVSQAYEDSVLAKLNAKFGQKQTLT